MRKRHGIILVAALLVLSSVLLTGCPKPPSEIETPMDPSSAGLPEPSDGPAEPAETYQVVVSTKPGQLNLDERVRGYRETFAGDYPQIEIVQEIDDETKYTVGEQQASAVMSANQDLDAFIGVNADMRPGAKRINSSRSAPTPPPSWRASGCCSSSPPSAAWPAPCCATSMFSGPVNGPTRTTRPSSRSSLPGVWPGNH